MYWTSDIPFSILFSLTARISALGTVISALEYFSLIREFGSGGTFSWTVLRPELARRRGTLSSMGDAVMGSTGVGIILSIRVICGTILAVVPLSFAASLSLLSLFITGCILSYRLPFGSDGADQMSTIITAGLATAAWGKALEWQLLGFWFIAAQSCLAYLVSGAAKVLSQDWRRGSAIQKILNTRSYGIEHVARLLERWPKFSFVLCWAVILFEVIFPVVLVTSVPISLLILFIGILFHLGNAALMGLNTFLWSFVATYPAIWYCRRFHVA